MDIRKVQSIVKEIYAGGNIKVKITQDLDSMDNSDRILAIGSSRTIKYQYLTSAETMANYFVVIAEKNTEIVELIDKYTIASSQFFPIFGFKKIRDDLRCAPKLEAQQLAKLNKTIASIPAACQTEHNCIAGVLDDKTISPGYKSNAIFWAVWHGTIDLDDCEKYLRGFEKKSGTEYRKLLCVYDYRKYGE